MPTDDHNDIVLNHYMTMNRYGDKGIVPEIVDANSPTAKLLRRLEEKRLSADSHRTIDLRGKVAGRVFKHKHHGKTHFLDSKAKRIFEEAIKKHDGRYTVEAYENVVNAEHTFKAKQKVETKKMLEEKRRKDAQKKKVLGHQTHQSSHSAPNQAAGVGEAHPDGDLQESIDALFESDIVRSKIKISQFARFGNVCVRTEPRMTFVTQVTIQRLGGEATFARTVDLSTGGVQVSFDTDDDFGEGEEVFLQFTALEDEFNEKVLRSQYRVLDILHKDHKSYMKLSRLSGNDDRAFITFFESFIEKNKRRYKTDCQDLVERLTSRVFEHSYCQNVFGLPLLVNMTKGNVSISACLINQQNKDMHHELTAQSGKFLGLKQLITTVANQKRKPSLGDGAWHFTIYSCLGTQGSESSLYVIASTDFKNENEQLQFLKWAQCQNRFRAYRVLISPLTKERKERAYEILDTVPEYRDLTIGDALQFVDQLTHMVLVHDITQSVSAVRDLTEEEIDEKALTKQYAKYFVKPLPGDGVETLHIGFKRSRAEKRYLYETEANVQTKTQSYKGKTIDFSIKGMCVELNAPSNLNSGTEVDISLPSFAKVTKDKRLKNMSYEIMRLSDDRKTLFLQRTQSSELHGGSEFFKALIEKNKDKLEMCNREDVKAFKTKIGQILTVSNLVTLPFFLGKGEKKSVELKTVGYSDSLSHFDKIFQYSDDEYDIGFLMDEKQLKRLVKDAKRAEEVGKHYSTDVYLFKNFQGELICRLARELDDEKVFVEYMKKVNASQINKIYHIKLHSAVKLNKLDFEVDLSQIRVRSLSKHKWLNEQMDNISFVGEVVDITDTIPHRI